MPAPPPSPPRKRRDRRARRTSGRRAGADQARSPLEDTSFSNDFSLPKARHLVGHLDSHLFESATGASYRSALAILTRLFAVYRPASAVAVGCGSGEWLLAALALGAERLVGYDSPQNETAGRHPEFEFRAADLTQPLRCNDRFDLALSVDVAEHLPAGRANGLVDDLCWLADVVVFSAAVPGQGGPRHVNEQWPSYWADRFAARGYQRFDVFRGFRWFDDALQLRHRQNTFLFVSGKAMAAGRIDVTRLEALQQPPTDLVHPELYALKERQLAGMRSCLEAPDLRVLRAVLARFVRQRLGALLQ